jgi:hypothetical protein
MYTFMKIFYKINLLMWFSHFQTQWLKSYSWFIFPMFGSNLVQNDFFYQTGGSIHFKFMVHWTNVSKECKLWRAAGARTWWHIIVIMGQWANSFLSLAVSLWGSCSGRYLGASVSLCISEFRCVVNGFFVPMPMHFGTYTTGNHIIIQECQCWQHFCWDLVQIHVICTLCLNMS